MVKIAKRAFAFLPTILVIVVAVQIALAGEESTKEEKIAQAMRASPPAISQDATIVDVDGTELRPGVVR